MTNGKRAATLLTRNLTLFSVLLASVSGAFPESGRVAFGEHIAPIIFDNCSVRHHPEAAAPFSLLSYRDVFKRGRLIAEVTRTRYMPPWVAAQGWGEFKGERFLCEEEIDLIRQWVEELGNTRALYSCRVAGGLGRR